MHGNVWEWIEDCWHDSYAGAPNDGRAWTSGCRYRSRVLRGGSRVLRGGSWNYGPRYLRAAVRLGFVVDFRDYLGFRVARTLFTP